MLMLSEQTRALNKGLFLPGVPSLSESCCSFPSYCLPPGMQVMKWPFSGVCLCHRLMAKRVPIHRLPLKSSVAFARLSLATSEFNRAVFYTYPIGAEPKREGLDTVSRI